MTSRSLTSIYPDEFKTFVQQTRTEITRLKFRYDKHVVEVVLDTEEVNSKVSRDG